MPMPLWRARWMLLDKTEVGTRPVRLLGVSVHNFGPEVIAAPEPQARLPFDV